ncbi:MULTISPECIES: DUF6167 family protein [Jiangella]|uniref:Secreted protein n=1 Tax=Jiangella alba TaxID=561176 RepID=A0A1H5M7T1_9ACTN|nr:MULTISPECIES: DUF6167 family protein [Jiangella]SDT03605.1 hypothetical protein SAMN04515669_2596 [Jiangella sp. DSM 45060]SEE84837.1 hypothetical protein SAMN04488561_2964 [Jiangella alba]
MGKLFWIALGATAGVLVVRRLTKAAESLTPEGAADRVAGGLRTLGDAVREFTDEVRAGMAERDAELRYALGIAPDGTGTQGVADPDAVDDLFHPHSRGTF